MQAHKPNIVKSLEWNSGRSFVRVGCMERLDLDRKKIRVPQDRGLDGARISNLVALCLDQWMPKDSCRTRDDFARELAGYLNLNIGMHINLWPLCSQEVERPPDILVENLIAIEIDVEPAVEQRITLDMPFQSRALAG